MHSGIIKLGKLTRAATVYRGVSDALPSAFSGKGPCPCRRVRAECERTGRRGR